LKIENDSDGADIGCGSACGDSGRGSACGDSGCGSVVVIIVNVVVVPLVAVLSYRAWIYKTELLVGNCNPLVYKYFKIFSN
jgi:hypothetical protein